MEDNTTIFWDKKLNNGDVKDILKDELNPRFVEFAALLLSRTNEPRKVFNEYVSRENFVHNWAKIKRKMRLNKWNDNRIIFWDEVYQAVKKNSGIKVRRETRTRPLNVDADIKALCDLIRDVRQKSGLTQMELANQAGLSQQSISFVEQGYTNVSLRTLKKITDALKLRIVLKFTADT